MAKLFDGKCVNPNCELKDEVVEDIWGEAVDYETKMIIGSVCDACNDEVQHVLAGIQYIDKSGGSEKAPQSENKKAGRAKFVEFIENPGQARIQEGDLIVKIGKKVTTTDGSVKQSIAAGQVEKIYYRKKSNNNQVN